MEGVTADYFSCEMWNKLLCAPTIKEYLDEIRNKNMPAFSEYIDQLCVAQKEKHEDILKRSAIEPSYGHKLFAGSRNPSRDTALQFAFGLQLGLKETQQLLIVARKAPLHPWVGRDAVIAYCLHHGCNLTETQIQLQKNDLPILGGIRHDR